MARRVRPGLSSLSGGDNWRGKRQKPRITADRGASDSSGGRKLPHGSNRHVGM